MNIINDIPSYSIVFEDEFIIAVNKDAGMLTIPDRYNLKLPNLRTILDEKFGKIFVVHRLDRDTSGIMVFAKDADSHKFLNDQFQNYKVTKIYYAMLKGVLGRDEFLVDIPLMPSPTQKGFTIPSARGKESYSKFKVIERFKNSTFVEIELLTGRHHQIRAHAAAIGHPLLVDELYSGESEFLLSSIKRKYNLKKTTEEKPIISRITLHSQVLEVLHPKSGENIRFEAELPKDFSILIKQLRKFAALPEFYVKNTELV